MRDPVRAAKKAIKQYSEELSNLYLSQSYLYLVDELSLVPSRKSSQGRTAYPIELEPNPRLIANVLLPFMNIVVMKALAKNGFDGLASLLGLPPSLGVPNSWRPSEPGLLHSMNSSASVEDFVILQKILRKDDLSAFLDDVSVASMTSQSYHSASSIGQLSMSGLSLAAIDLSPVDPAIASVPMIQLELLFRERDPDREFGELKRVMSGTSGDSSKSLGLWTDMDTIKQMRNMVEIAEVEEQLREMKSDILKIKTSASLYASLLDRRKILKSNLQITIIPPDERRTSSFLDNSLDDSNRLVQDHDNHVLNQSNHSENSKHSSEQEREQQTVDESEMTGPGSRHPSGEKLDISTHKMPHYNAPPNPNSKIDPDPEGLQFEARKKMRKSKRRWRPWFNIC